MKPIRILSVAACLFAVTSIVAQNLITEATDAVRFSKRDFADTIKIKVMDGAVVVPVEHKRDGSFCALCANFQKILW